MKRLLGTLGIFLLAAQLFAQTNAPVRLALIYEAAELSAAGDVLTAQLSKDPQIRLLERDEIDRVYREQGLSVANRDYLKLGHLLGADGLLVLQLTRETALPQLSVRLVAVKPGVTLRQREYPWPPGDLLEWAGAVVPQYRPLFPKLMVLAKEALPISILNLHSAVASVSEEATERELTELLYARLENEKDIFILERRRLELLEAEKEQSDAAEGPFWNGSYLLEGIIDKAGYRQDTVTVEARLTPPDKKEMLTVDISGPRTNLPAVADALAIKLLVALNRGAGAAAWNPQAEADRYFAEGQWMLKWGMFPAAKSASEAAWALGRQDRETAELRVKAYQAAADEPGICMVINDSRRVTFGQPLNPNVHDFSELAAYASAPHPDQFADLVRADELYLEAFRRFAEPNQKLAPAWLILGRDILERTSLWLRYFYFTAEARPGQETRIEAAKQLCRDITRVMEGHPDFANADTNHLWLILKAQNVAFWWDTPEPCLPVYRAMVETGQWPIIRRRFFNAAYAEVNAGMNHRGFGHSTVSDALERLVPHNSEPALPPANPANPCFTGWTWNDRQRCPVVWSSFIDELCGSTQPLIRLEGLVLRCSYSWSEADFEQNLEILLGFVQQQRVAIAAADLDGRLPDDLNTMINLRMETLSPERRVRVQDQIQPEFEKVFAGLREQYGNADERKKQLAMFEEQKHYLNSQTNFDFMSYVRTLFNQEYRPDEARELLPLLTNYEARIRGHPPGDGTNRLALMRYQSEQKQIDVWVGQLREKLVRAVSPATPPTNVRSEVVASRAAASAPKLALPNTNPPPAAAHASLASPLSPLEIHRFWEIPTPVGIETVDAGSGNTLPRFNGQEYVPQIASCCYRDGKLWVEVRYDQMGFAGRAAFYAVDLQTFAASRIEFEGEQGSLPGLFSANGSRPFEVHGGCLYLSVGGAIRKYSFKQNAWEQFRVPASGKVLPVRLGNRLFFTSSSSILECAGDGSFRTLASCRRQPPASLLDKLDSYGSPHLFLNAAGTLQARIGTNVYAFSTITNDWFPVATLPQVDESNYRGFDDGFLALSPNLGGAGVWLGMFGHSTSPTNLFRRSWPQGTVLVSPFGRSQRQKQLSTCWPIDLPSLEICLQDNHLWFLTGAPKFRTDDSRRLRVQASDEPGPTMTRFATGDKQPLTIPIRFKTDDIKLTPVAAGSLASSYAVPWWHKWILQWTPQGMVMIARAPVPGFWFIPAPDLEAAVARAEDQRRLETEADRAQQRREVENLNARHEEWRKELLATYDKNQNGTFEPEEREAMIDDPHYLELELPAIDANTNGLLDAAELRFFDPDSNGMLEPREQKAIETALALFADQMMAKLTPDADGKVDPADLPDNLMMASGPSAAGPRFVFDGTAASRGDKIGREELITMLRSHLSRELLVSGQRIIPSMPPGMRTDAESLFRARVEAYWRASGSKADPPPRPANSPP